MTDFRVLVVSRQDWKVLKYSLSSYSMSERLYLRRQILNMGQTGWKYWNFAKSETRLRHVSFCEYWRLELLPCEKSEIQSSNFYNLDFYERERCFTAFLLKIQNKHCQRPGYWLRNLNDLFQPTSFPIDFSQKSDSSHRPYTGLFCLWQCTAVFPFSNFQYFFKSYLYFISLYNNPIGFKCLARWRHLL